jgi:sulfide:quinone oxidoreductase
MRAAPSPGRHRVVIAGAGVAGLEALLALHELAPDRVELVLLAPSDRFVYRPLLVTEPFGGGGAPELGLSGIVEDTGASHVREALASVDPRARSVRTSGGTDLRYDALLVALGATPVEAVSGALTFGDEDGANGLGALLSRMGRRGTKRLAFVVPPAATWALAAYELALLTAGERAARRLAGVEISLVTHEAAPLELLGEPASALIGARLAEAGIDLRLASRAVRFVERRLELEGAAPLDVDAVVALPKLTVANLQGLAQTEDGFLRTDAQMHVADLEHVWAAGDVTSFPVKQGGLAAQQAGVAARTIAAKAGAHVPFEPFAPVLRAALITGGPVEYMRTAMHDRASSEVSEGGALWSPPAKIAGRYLGAYLASAFGAARSPQLVDLGVPADPGGRPGSPEVLLAAADADGRLGDYEGALGWLALVERLDFVIPPEYLPRRQEWRRKLDATAPADPAAERIEPALAGAAEAISDLQRRLGWLRELEQRQGGQMGEQLSQLNDGIEDLIARTRRGGS